MESPSKPKVTWAEAFRDIALRMIDKGQWAAFLLGMIVLVVVFRLDSDELVALVRELLMWTVVPWVLLGLCIMGWYFHVRFVDHTTKGENRRLGTEKTMLQERLAAMQRDLEALHQETPHQPPTEPTEL